MIRITLFAKRRPDLTREQFYEYWEKFHAPLTAPWLVKYNVIGYCQVNSHLLLHLKLRNLG